MPAIETPKDMKQTITDLEAAILSQIETFYEATGKRIILINTWVGGDGEQRVQVTREGDL